MATIWQAPSYEPQDLKQLLIAKGLGAAVEDWQLLSVEATSADGNVLFGAGINPNGDGEVFRIVIPEPASLTIFAVCLFAVVTASRKQLCR